MVYACLLRCRSELAYRLGGGDGGDSGQVSMIYGGNAIDSQGAAVTGIIWLSVRYNDEDVYFITS